MSAQARPKQAARGYGGDHKAERRRWEPKVAEGRVDCVRCGGPIEQGEAWDLGHYDDDRSRWAGPEHVRCNRATSSRRNPRVKPARPRLLLAPQGPPPERAGLAARDDRWDVPWLAGLRRPGRGASWPRLMTVPHPRAAGSAGPEFIRWADKRTQGRLRWWQRLAATRMLEVDTDGLLVWDTVLLSMARQLGKSWLLRELCLWRIEQGDRWGETQDVLHTGKDLAVVVEVQRSARVWARPQQQLYEVREANGAQRIEYKPGHGGRWLVKAKGAPYGYTISSAVVDEAWNVEANYIEEGVAPTMVERVSPQLLLVSTAHRLATSLMLTRRRAALDHLETGMGDLLIEWSAPRDAEIAEPSGWRQASPHWSQQRERLIRRKLDAIAAGETLDPDEPDPEQSFRAQWLNIWPNRHSVPDEQDLLPDGLWEQLAEPGVTGDGPLWVAVEDDFGKGAAVAAASVLDDGRIEVDGWRCQDWDTALADAAALGEHRRIRKLLVGASMLSRVPPGTVPPPEPAGSRETRPGLALFRDLAAGGMLVHDVTTRHLDDAVGQAQVKEQAAGLALTSRGPTHLVRAAVWAVQAAHKPAPLPAVY
jgi:hypothetical protein